MPCGNCFPFKSTAIVIPLSKNFFFYCGKSYRCCIIAVALYVVYWVISVLPRGCCRIYGAFCFFPVVLATHRNARFSSYRREGIVRCDSNLFVGMNSRLIISVGIAFYYLVPTIPTPASTGSTTASAVKCLYRD